MNNHSEIIEMAHFLRIMLLLNYRAESGPKILNVAVCGLPAFILRPVVFMAGFHSGGKWSRKDMGIDWYRSVTYWGKRVSSIFYFGQPIKNYVISSNNPAWQSCELTLWKHFLTKPKTSTFQESFKSVMHFSGLQSSVDLIILSGEVQFCKTKLQTLRKG